MSILIRGAEMPKETTAFVFSKNGKVSRFSVGASKDRMFEAVEIPTPHGRLIDEEAVIDHFVSLSNNEWNQNVSTSWANAFAEAASDISDIPTIIGAEEGG